MSVVLALLAQVLHIAFMILAAPTAAGVLDCLDARLAGRSGPPILLPWRDLLRLARKTPLAAESSPPLVRSALAISLGATLSAAALVPSFAVGMAFSPLADVLVIVSLLTVARVAAAFAALESGAPLPGLMQQENSMLAVLAEPTLVLAVATPALMGGSFNLDLIIGQQRDGVLLPAAASAVALTAMLALVFADASAAETGTEQMLAGTSLAMSRMAAWLRRLIWIDLIGAVFLPVGIATADAGLLAWLTGFVAWALKTGCFLLGLSVVQTMLGRISRHSLPDLIGVAALLAVLAIILVLASTGIA